VIAIRQYAPLAREHAVDRTGQSGRDAHHSAAQGFGIPGFDDEVHVVRLDRVVDESETLLIARGSEGALDFTHQPGAAQ
jgi:hypothetical protein